MKFKVTATATEVRANTRHEITGTIHAASARAARIETMNECARHGYEINGVPEVEEQH
ncbi:hypothetical protein [Streptomyces caniscabiei]|uniref:hypothetical protein n=1 Tax=Streptomyces caniscabiei TaxID=2746961 RepID=UPI0029BD4615|nr:hypothetical protein [Streptomyces caniscabiei]MDX2954581.1 hypothetical protein [Streptomyces caniscabiei]